MRIKHLEARESTKLTKYQITDEHLINLNASDKVNLYNTILDQLRAGGKDPYLDSLYEKRLVLDARIEIESELKRTNSS